MVIKALLNAWRSHTVIRQIYDEFIEMLDATEWMFATVGRILFEEMMSEDVSKELYARDVHVNKAERSIRRQIMEHLAVHPGGDVPACLVLMSLVKDAERIGDYCKNLYEVRAVLGKGLSTEVLDNDVKAVHARILETFAQTQKALGEGDAAVAREVVRLTKEVAHELEEKVQHVAVSNLPTQVAVCRALALRHMKRIHAHLCNIASSVVQPVHKLDYFDEGSLYPPK